MSPEKDLPRFGPWGVSHEVAPQKGQHMNTCHTNNPTE